MGKTLDEIAQQLKECDKNVQLIYAFNGTGKTRLSKKFKEIVEPRERADHEVTLDDKEFLYYNAFTEDLFYWDNDLEPKLKIHPNLFTKWVLQDQGNENNVIDLFQKYTSGKLMPKFENDFSIVTFSYALGNEKREANIKISKGEESNFVWCIFYTVLQERIENLGDNVDVKTKYIFIDDPVTSLDDNHLIHLAVDLAKLVKKAIQFDIKFFITTHNALFYNILLCEFNVNDKEKLNADGEKIHYRSDKHFQRYVFNKLDDGTYMLDKQGNKSPFSYHIYLMKEIENAIRENNVKKYHFNFLRNIYEKTATFLGYEKYTALLPMTTDGEFDKYSNRVINAYSHSKNSDEEVALLDSDDRVGLVNLYNHLVNHYKFKEENQ